MSLEANIHVPQGISWLVAKRLRKILKLPIPFIFYIKVHCLSHQQNIQSWLKLILQEHLQIVCFLKVAFLFCLKVVNLEMNVLEMNFILFISVH